MKNIFTKSDNFKQEYACSIVRIGEILPIENSDYLGQTTVNGFPVVVRKDQVTEGEVMFYAPIESELNARFCAVNNLYEDKELNDDKEKKGYFNKYGRVRIVKLRGVPSMGFLFGRDEMAWLLFDKDGRAGTLGPEVLESLVGTDFDTVDGDLFVKAYVPRVKVNEHVGKGNGKKRDKNLKKFDRMIPGEFAYHYDTTQLEREIRGFKPEDSVTISLKLHGTSAIIGNIKVREPRWKGGLYEKYFEYLPKFLQFTNTVYDYIYSSRTVIKNKNINSAVTGGFYGTDVWAKYHDLFVQYDLLPKGMTIYGEIIGFTDDGKAIQKLGAAYDYGCKQGENKLMIYRISEELPDGTHYEWDVPQVHEWTMKMLREHPEMEPYIHPIDILYCGKLKDLYPDLDTANHWHENLINRMKVEKAWFMEEDEPLCKNKVPREGVVLRKNGDILKEAFKLKTMKFRFGEAKSVDAGNADIEMLDAYGDSEGA